MDVARRQIRGALNGACASRDSNAGPSAPEAAPASAHERWLLLFQALSCVLRRAAQFNAGRLVTTVVTTIDLGPQIMHLGVSCPHSRTLVVHVGSEADHGLREKGPRGVS